MRNSPHKLVTSVLKMLLECTCNEKSDIYHLLDYYTRVRKTENGVFKSKMHDLFILQNTHTQPSTNGEYSRINMYNKGNLIKIKSSQYRGYLKGTKNIYIYINQLQLSRKPYTNYRTTTHHGQNSSSSSNSISPLTFHVT